MRGSIGAKALNRKNKEEEEKEKIWAEGIAAYAIFIDQRAS